MSEKLDEIYSIINKVLKNINQPKLGMNERLKPEKLNFVGYERYWSAKEDRKLFFMIEIDETRVTFHIDRTEEIPEFSYNQIIENRKEFEKFIEVLFTHNSQITHKGNKTIVEFLDKNNNSIYSFKYFNGIGLNFLKKKKIFEYPPYFQTN
ncbi:hypothetical protein [Flavobacterium sp.]|uniref:hypothetical protein n=1 Tax=Flavobacterium sp. TaxID=239 RepID=UPI001B68648D|nr:hypothetical protein [Flavobacterium sp.]MBP6127742.1 hypothetical protein [Flavobacterium sp.]